MLINLTNDGWYANSSELDIHLAIGVFRTIEHRVPLARAVNTGLSALVDGNGEIRAVLPKDIEDVLTVTVPLDDRTTYYSRWGDWLGLSCLAVAIGWFPLGLIRNRRAGRPERLTRAYPNSPDWVACPNADHRVDLVKFVPLARDAKNVVEPAISPA